MPNALKKPYCHLLAYLRIVRSAMPMCIAMLVNQAKNVMCQNEKWARPSSGAPVQIFWFATAQRSPTELTPSWGRTATPHATNTSNIHGAATFENRAICLKPKIASSVTAEPTTSTVTTHPTVFGYRSLSPGIAMSKGIPTAVAATDIIAPARKQNMRAFTMLYTKSSFGPAILRSFQ